MTNPSPTQPAGEQAGRSGERVPERQIAVDTMEGDPSGNNLVATGALFAVLASSGAVECGIPGGNTLTVRFSFMKSPYRITVERIRDEQEAATDA
jgi:hypothetical protein